MFSQHSDVKANPKTPESIRSAFIKAFGGKAIVQLEANNLIQIVATAAELPTGLNISKTGIAVFAGNKAYFIADRMSADTAHQALLHEIGEHYGLERMLGIEAYDTLLAKVRELKDSDAVVQAAWDFVSKNYPTLSSDSKNFMHEVLAQIGQNADISARSWWKQVLEAAKRFLVKLGFTGMVKVSDIQDMVLHSLKVAATLSNNELASNQSSLFDGAALASNADQTDTLAFKQWFGDSKVVDTDGKPLVVYHGTGSDFDTFKKTMPAHGMNKKPQNGFFFTDTFTAGSYAVMNEMYGKSNANIMPIYLKLSNPIIIDRKGREFLDSVSLQKWVRSQVDRYQNSMHDGLIIKNINDIGAYLETQYVVFSPNQIKSAIGNNGNFDSSSNNILESRGNFFDGISMDMLRADLTHRANDTFNTKKTFNNWWHKTFGTQYHKAQVDPEHFGKVYDMAQLFIRDLARYANTAADQAPNLLPKMESVMDAVHGLGAISRDNADAKAIAAPIFEGTLNDEVYDTDKLRSRFNLTDRQITLYKEFRASVNQSLDDLAISEMGRLARTEAIPRAPEGVSLDEATAYYRQHYEGDLEKAKLALDDLKERQHQERGLLKDAAVDIDSEAHVDMLLNMHTRHATELAEANAAVDNFMELHKGIQEKADEINALKANGYAPLMRFGRYTVDVYIENKDGTVFKDASGEEQRQFFGMFESEAEANYMARMLQDEYPSSVVKQGILSQEEFNLFRGVTPETIELYAKLVGDSQSAAFQKYLKMAVNNRSAMKRLIKRLGVKGFSDDPTRVLASFITSNARAAASNDYFGDMLKQVSDIPKHKGDVKDEAIKLMEYIQNPQEEASKLRGLLFMNFLGGSIASALVNMTQPILMTYPYLHQFSPSAAKHLAWAMKVASKKLVGKDFKIDDEALTFALSRAADEGVTSPHEVYMLYGEASRTSALSGNRWLRNLTKVWGGFFAVAENFNRHATFIAAFKIAEENGLSNDAAYDFAKKAVDDTQGVYCVDRETEILTHEGWMRMENLVVGMPVYSVDDKGRLIDSVLENVHIFSGAHKVHHFTNSNGFSMVVTDNHDCMIQNYNSRDEKWQALRKVKAKDIKNSHHVLRVPQGDATGRVAVYTDDEVRLFSWVAAEGHLFAHRGTHVKRGVGLSQSLTHNPEYVAEIDALLERLGGHYNRKSAFKKKRGDTMIYWQLRKILWMKVHLALPAKQITPEFVSKLTTSQMEIFLQVFVQADGHIPEEGHAVIVQKSIQNLDMLHMMATLSGHGASVRHRSDQHDFGYLCLHKQTKRSHVKAMSVTTEIVDTVWCPETTSGNWIARRNGRTFVTGNSKANRPNWARGAVGATLFTFKQFSVAYIEFLKRLPAKERALALAILVLASGVQGLPIVSDDLDDLIDTLMQSLGLSWNTKEEKRDFVAKIFGKEGANYVMYGISNGLPIDLAGRLSAGNLLPMTAILKKSESDKTRDVGEFFGAVGGAATNYMTGFEKLQGGNYTGAAKAIAPKALSDAFKGYDMWVTGEAHDSKGRLTAKATPIDALVKAIGFNPSHIAASSRDRGMLIQDANLLKVTQSNIYERWSQGVAQKDADKLASAKAELARWNAKNPTQKIEIKLSTIQRRVKAMHQDANERFIKSSPKQLRAENTAILNQ